mgnify:CR=1 FL=1
MAKKKKDLDIDAQIGETKISIDRNEESFDVDFDGKKMDVNIHKDKDSKSFNFDSEKLDVFVNQENGKTDIQVTASNKFLKWIGNVIGKFVSRKKKK